MLMLEVCGYLNAFPYLNLIYIKYAICIAASRGNYLFVQPMVDRVSLGETYLEKHFFLPKIPL